MDWRRGPIIGRGSTATVSIATCGCSGDVFAVKTAELSESELLQREQKFLSTLSSPQIVKYKGYDITTENNKLMYNLKMEYAAMGTLSDGIQKNGGRLDESMISCYTHQILQGLEYLHSSGVVHCDIKGQNILIGENGAKIADLGCAKWANPEASVSQPIGGTPMFMAPEVARGEEQGFPADIWALGFTIIEMATGGSPWPNVTDSMSILYQIAYSGKSPDVPNFLSQQLQDFLNNCLKIDPKERRTVKQLMEHPFLEEFSCGKKPLNSNSPTSILDQGIWNSIEEESKTPNNVFRQPNHLNSSPEQRIKRLLSNSRIPEWRSDETWITIRRQTSLWVSDS